MYLFPVPCDLDDCALLPLLGSTFLFNMAYGTPPGLALNGYPEPTTTMDNQPSVSNFGEPHVAGAGRPGPARADTNYTMASMMSVPPEGSVLTGKQEHCKQYRSPAPSISLTKPKTSSANSSHSKHNTKSPSSPQIQLSSVLARPSAQTPAKSRPKTRSSHYYATYSSTMCGIFLSWTRPKRRSFGRTSCKW